MSTFNIETTVCGACGLTFGLDERFLTQLRKTGREFFCPNGHRIAFTEVETETNKLKKSLASALADLHEAQEKIRVLERKTKRKIKK